MKTQRIEEFIGIYGYASKTEGIEGKIREKVEDFIVEEVTPEGEILKVGKDYGFNVEKRSRYLVFLLEKYNWDTFKAIDVLARHLNVKPENFSFAGIKDKRAITIQRVSVWRVRPEDLLNVKINGLYIRGCWYSDNKVSIGDLWGNRFRITIRKINLDQNETQHRVKRVLSEIKEIGGVPNFFGFQRFGTKRPMNHIIGKYIVKGQFRDAVIKFLTETAPYEDEKTKEARLTLREDLDFKKAAEIFPDYLWYEKRMLKFLANHPKSYISALRLIPKQLRIMFTHSYTSYLFNKFVSYRMKMEALNEVFEGDIILKVGKNDLPSDEAHEVSSSNIKEIQREIRTGRAVVALPLVGYGIKIPRGETGEIIKKVLEEEGIKPEDFRVKSMPELSVKGAYRSIVLKIKDFEVIGPVGDELNPSTLKILMQFSIPRGGYATTVLREFMKPRDPILSGF